MKTKNSNFKIIIIIVAAAIILAGVGFVIYRAIDRFVREDEPVEVVTVPNVTMFRFYMGRTVTDAELDEIKEVVGGVVGANRVLEINKGGIFRERFDAEGNQLDMGDSITIIFSVLEEGEWGTVFGALVDQYDITPDLHLEGIENINRADF